ncbi:hypothetical protein [Leptospira bandrabouensis]|uniref:Uncharacterized protein n=1 Tax=Leptospira bandrabouensis TaxID=2484903 RepID=A0A6H3NT81_9LEPT|nr:hypothetical protein [Leptospira bandrabouensis]TGN07446.1 hypothetical protein EHR07_04810 [Leptospira bandrabouensis]TGN12809.1 hypothetical protein EHR08_15795 [Leptospira bandrabouensis]
MEIGIKELIGIIIGVSIYFVRNENLKGILKLKEETNEKIQANKDLIIEVKNENEKSNERVISKLGNIEDDVKRTENSIKTFAGESSATRELVIKIYEEVMGIGKNKSQRRSK